MTITHDASAGLSALAALAQRTRDFADAVMESGVDAGELAAVTAELEALTERLRAAPRVEPLPQEFTTERSFRALGNAVIGECNPMALPLVVERPEAGGNRADITFRRIHEGPPTYVHGGISAMILDHLLGDAVAAAGHPSMTGTLSIRYRRPVQYGVPVVASAEFTRAEGRKTWAEGRIADTEGNPLVEATGLFISPAAWKGGMPA